LFSVFLFNKKKTKQIKNDRTGRFLLLIRLSFNGYCPIVRLTRIY
jgi:hypothetical protein